MEIKFRKNESAASLIEKGKNSVTRHLNSLAKGEGEIFEKFRAYSPDFAYAVKDYVGIYKKLKKDDSDTGLQEEFDLATKNLIKAFKFGDATKDYSFLSDNFFEIKKSPLYIGMETIFDASLFREAGKQRLFTNIYNLSLTVRKVLPDCFIFYAKPYFYFVDCTRGMVLKRYDYRVDDFFFEDYVWNDETGALSYQDEELFSPFDCLMGDWRKPYKKPKRSGSGDSGTEYWYINFTSPETAEHFGGHFGMPVHQIVMLCWYGLNVMKFCIGSASLLTVDHINDDSLDNSIMNLAIVTRMANISKEHHGTKGTNFLIFFEVCGYCATPFDYKYVF